MEARNVSIYFIPDNINKIDGRFYNIYLNKQEKLDLISFLNSDDLESMVTEKSFGSASNDKIKGISKDEKIKEYDVILTFNNVRNNKDYVVYTDNLYDKDGKIKIFSALYDIDSPDPFIGYPASNEEWKDIYELLDGVILNRIDNELNC